MATNRKNESFKSTALPTEKPESLLIQAHWGFQQLQPRLPTLLLLQLKSHLVSAAALKTFHQVGARFRKEFRKQEIDENVFKVAALTGWDEIRSSLERGEIRCRNLELNRLRVGIF
jgi:hypothetical protein